MQKIVKLRLDAKQIAFSDSGFLILSLCYKAIITLTVCLLFLSTQTGFCQTEKHISVALKDASIKSALTEVQNLSGVKFTYGEYIDKYNSVKINYEAKDVAVGEAVRQILKETNLKASFLDGYMVIEEKTAKETSDTNVASSITGIKGRIVDFETSQPLAGASIKIMELKKGTISNDKGYYHFNDVPPGKYTLQVSYIGYENYQQQIEIKVGKAAVLDIKLRASDNVNSSVSVLQTVTVSGQRRLRNVMHTTERAMVQEIKNSTGIVSGISNEMIAKTTDRNAAEIVKRISGVSVVDSRFIIVRGMNERYNLTYLNGDIAPSTEQYDKAFAYDLLPSSIIDRILVYKSPTADLVADYAGAAIKIYTKNAMPVRHFDIGIQLGHRPGSTLSDIISYQGGKYDFLGLDDGSRKLPSFSPSYFQSNKNVAGIDQQTMVKGFSPNLSYGTTHSLPDMQFFANYYNTWKIGAAHLYDLTSVNYTYETKNYSIYRQVGNTYRFLTDGNPNYGNSNKIEHTQQSTITGKFNILENLTLKLNDRNQLQFKNFFINQGEVQTNLNNSQMNTVPEIAVNYGYPLKRDIILSFQQRRLYFGNLSGEHRIGDRHLLDWNIGYTSDRLWIPDQRSMHFAESSANGYYNISAEDPDLRYVTTGTNTVSINDGYLGMISRVFILSKEHVYNASLDYTFKVSPVFTFKAGTYQMFKTREVGRRIFRVNSGGVGNGLGGDNVPPGWAEGLGESDLNTILFREQDLPTIWNPKNFPADGSGLWITDATDPTNSYVGSEQNNSGYIMGDWNTPDKKITLNAGLRLEYDNERISGAQNISGGIYSVSASHPKTSLLPSATFSYRPDTAFIIRAAYGRTMNRPDIRELTPYSDFDYQDDETIAGNPSIVSATIDNYDIRAEWYPRSLQQNEMLSIGAFYKRLKNPIERYRFDKSGYTDPGAFTLISFGNAVSAKLYGVEADIRKNLSFISDSRLFRNLSVTANVTWDKSSTQEYGGYVVTNDTGRAYKGRPLQGQSPYIVNAGLFYENPAWGTKIGLTYNVNGPRIYAKSSGNWNYDSTSLDAATIRPDLLELPQQLLDLAITQRIVKSLQVKLSIQNILNQPIRIIEDQNYNQRYDKEMPVMNSSGQIYYVGDNISTKYYPGRYFVLTFTYAF